jgi:Domain of unknown function (DUF4424)
MGLPMRFLPLLAFSAILAGGAAFADDGAASIAAGGIVMTREPRITMAKEVLSISEGKVVVDYDFRNDTGADITTKVAFPIPEYVDDPDGVTASVAGFEDFKLWVNDKQSSYLVETRAFTKKGEITKLLATLKIDAASFGHEKATQRDLVNDLSRLSKTARQRLVAAGAIDSVDDLSPNWSVKKKYYWTQSFPAHSTVRIRHEYTPVLGNSNSVAYETMPTEAKAIDKDSELPSVCPTADLLRTLRQEAQRPHHVVSIDYVDFILTTANTWKRPIEDFTMNVERPPLHKDPNHPATGVDLVTFCWNGTVEKVDANHFRVHTTDFVPTKEVRIGFLHGYLMGD